MMLNCNEKGRPDVIFQRSIHGSNHVRLSCRGSQTCAHFQTKQKLRDPTTLAFTMLAFYKLKISNEFLPPLYLPGTRRPIERRVGAVSNTRTNHGMLRLVIENERHLCGR
jgi:hypothetical protein